MTSGGKIGGKSLENEGLRGMPTICGVSSLDWIAYWAADLHNMG